MVYNKTAFEIEEDKISKINSAGIINITIENLWRECYSSMVKGNLVSWNRNLDAIWLILGGDSKDGTDDVKFNSIDLELHKTGSLSHKKVGFITIGEKESEVIALQYLILRKKSLFLRRLQNIQGKGTAYQNSDMDDFD